MWCSECRQDVPGIASQADRQLIVCARCGSPLTSSGVSPLGEASAFPPAERVGYDWESATSVGSPLPVIDLDDWQLDSDLRAAEQLVGHFGANLPPQCHGEPLSAASPETLQDFKTWHTHSNHNIPEPPCGLKRIPRRRHPEHGWLSWTFLSVGIMSFMCGAILSGLSFVAGHAELWNVGLPLVLAGQAGLLLGLIFQLEGLWQTSRETSQTLDELDSRLDHLSHTSTAMGASPSSAARSFYTHMAEGASPQRLLSDLKGQLDMLAMKMSQDAQR